MKVEIDGVDYIPAPDVPTDKGLLAALEVRFDSDAGNNITVRDYLCSLLTILWEEGENFNGKYPFGNSGWEYKLYIPLICAGFIPGTLKDNGWIDGFDKNIAHAYVCDLIHAAFHGVLSWRLQ